MVLPAPKEEVWSALTDPDRLEEWFANEVELDACPGGEGVFRWEDGEERRAVVEEVEPERSFAFRWCDDDAGEETTVCFTLEDAPEGTLLTIVESAPGPRACAEWSWAIELQAAAVVAVA